MRRALLALASLLLVAACDTTTSLRELREARPSDDAYQAALAEGYKNYAEARAALYDWNSSKYFADKGLLANYGRDTQPEEPANWQIPPAQLPELNAARVHLLQAAEQTRTTQPGQTAAAAVAYDRWVDAQARVADESGDADEAHAAFNEAVGRLTEVQAVQAGPDAPSSEPKDPKKPETTSTILYFPFDSDRLGISAKAALTQLVHDIKAAGNVNVSINGHADRAGTEEYNLSLSERRAKFVQGALKKAGVPANLMKYFAFGESDPAVPTPDGVREPKNRRVEIFIE